MPVLLTTDGLSIDCPAKLNLTLAVGPAREDGYHPIASVMAAIDYGDNLIVNPLSDGPSRYARVWSGDRCDTADSGSVVQQVDWPIEQDLIYRAHVLMQEAVGKQLLIECGLNKRIPAGAGLGGGSSNAAGMLVALREVFGLDLSDERLVELGATLGADVSFAVQVLLGRPAALVTGVGEVVEPIASLPASDVVLVLPDGSCPTGAVYRAFDDAGDPKRSADELASLAEGWRGLRALPAPLNDLEPAAARVCPAVSQARVAMSGFGHQARMTGSGSALFVVAQTPDHAHQIAKDAQRAGFAAVVSRIGSGDPT